VNEDTRNALAAVRAAYPSNDDAELVAAEVDGFPEFVYVTRLARGRAGFGGEALVVRVGDGTIDVCSGSMPPRVNCQRVRDHFIRAQAGTP